MMAQKVPYYVIPYDNGWAVRRAEQDRILEQFTEKTAAIMAGQQVAYQAGTGLIVYDTAGDIEHVDDPEDNLKFKPEIEARLERFQRGEYKSRRFKAALKE
jgi:hypothetical protein